MEKGGLVIRKDNKPTQPKVGGLGIVEEGQVRFQGQGARVDLVEVIDTTGSMSDKIDGLLATSQKFVDKLGASKIDWQMAVVGFGDLVADGPNSIVATSFSKNIEVVKKSLRNIPRFGGGGNEGESSLEALEKALSLQGYRPGAIKVFVFLTDEPALQGRQLTVNQVIADLQKREVLTFVVSIGLSYYQEMAKKTGGEWFPISATTDFLSILDRLMTKVTEIVVDVQDKAGGSVSNYLQLKGRS